MSNKLEKRLVKEIEEYFLNQKYQEVEAVFLAFRKLIEIRSTMDRFSTIRFYADWLAHSKIDKSVALYDFLHKINTGLHGRGVIYPESGIQYKDYIFVIIHALKLDELLSEIIDLIHFHEIKIPKTEGDIKINGALVYFAENSDKKKFLVENRNLHVDIPFITLNGKADRQKFLIELFKKLTDIPICYPSSDKNRKKKETSIEINKIQNKLNSLKHEIHQINSSLDYSKSFFMINAFYIEKVEQNAIHVAMKIEDKDTIIKSHFYT